MLLIFLAVSVTIQLLKDDNEGLANFGVELLKIPRYRNSSIGRQVAGLLRGMELEKIMQENSISKRASLLEKQARAAPADPNAPNLWFNAAKDYLNSGEILAALNSYRYIDKKYSTSKAHPEALLELAKLLRGLSKLQQSSDAFLKFSRKYAQDSRSEGALKQSCYLAIANDYKKSEGRCYDYYNKVGMRAFSLLERLLQVGVLAKDNTFLKRVVSRFYDANKSIPSGLRIQGKCALYYAFLPRRNNLNGKC